MEKAQILFEVTKSKTEMIATGIKGNTQRTNITDTELEKEFISLLKKVQAYRKEKLMLDAIDIDKYYGG